MDVVGTPTLQATTCGIEDNGNFTTSGAKLNVNAGTIGVVGLDTNNGGGTVTCSVNPSQCPVNGIPAVGDPLSYLNSNPPCTSCNGGGKLDVKGTQTVSPGTYSSITVNAGANATFSPGTYIIDGNKGLTINGGATVTGTGVTFYLTGSANVTINGGTGSAPTVQFSAPNSGTYAGVLFWQAPGDTSSCQNRRQFDLVLSGRTVFPKCGARLWRHQLHQRERSVHDYRSG